MSYKDILSGPEILPESAKHLVVLLHGYGSNGDDLISLAEEWCGDMPDTAFIAPNAFEPLPMMFANAYQWFDLSQRDPQHYIQGMEQAIPKAQAYLDAVLQAFALEDKNLSLVGFSQGAMMAISLGLNRQNDIAGVLGYSGKYIHPESLPVNARPEMLLIHGDHDDVVPFDSLHEAKAALQQHNVKVTTEACQGLGHSIDAKGLALGREFLNNNRNLHNTGE